MTELSPTGDGGEPGTAVNVPAAAPQWPTEEHPEAEIEPRATLADLHRRHEALEDKVTLWLRSLETEQFYLAGQLTLAMQKVEKVNKDFDTLEATLIDLSYQFSAIYSRLPGDEAGVDDDQGAPAETDDTGDLAAAFAAATAADAGQDNSSVGAAMGGPAAEAETPSPGEDGAEGVPMPSLSELHTWVEERIAPLVRKTTTTGEGGGIRWCRSWWLHRDAVERFSALYLAHAELGKSGEATWLSVYLRDHLDPHLGTLTNPYGPFHLCRPERHSQTVVELGQGANLDQQSGGT